MSIGRNDPCPCGSGKKYKRCCLALDEAKRQLEATPYGEAPHPAHELDERLIEEMEEYAEEHLGGAWDPEGDYPGIVDEASEPFFRTWSVYHYPVNGEPVARRFLHERGAALTATDIYGAPNDELWWIAAQLDAWVGIWEVTDVVPGKRLKLRDLLTGEEREVHETSASRLLAKYDTLLARVVDYKNESLLCGAHPAPLPPDVGLDIAKEFSRSINTVLGRASKDKLREPENVKNIIRAWESAVAQLTNAPLPKLQNTDGDDLLLVTDHFTLPPGAESEVRKRLQALEGAECSEEDRVVFVRDTAGPVAGLSNTVIGHAELHGERLRLETNSVRRADALRSRVENACKDLITHQSRTTTHPTALAESPHLGPLPSKEASDPETLEAERAILTEHYQRWLDTPLPILKGDTPRQAAKRPRKRAQVDLLLKGIENREARQPGGPRVDVAALRSELGLDVPQKDA